jgi:inosose dehydratase
MTHLSRRAFVLGAAAAPPLAGGPDGTIGLGAGTYGMKNMSTRTALRAIAEAGYDGVELALMAGWPAEPKLLDAAARRALREELKQRRLALPSLLENLPLLRGPEQRGANVERLKRAMELGHDLSPDSPPVVETILGGKTAAWAETKNQVAEELHEWARAAESVKTVVCFKPHAAHAVHNPERSLWLIEQVGSRWIRVVYDYSHLWLEGCGLAESMKQLLPLAPFVHLKDSAGIPEKHEYLLPGEGKTDYLTYFRLLKEHAYDGFAVVEVSSMIQNKPGYDPVATTKLCYGRLAPLIQQAGWKRRKLRA